ncbi:hypothetical protein [Turicimonas muris]|uniref:hypothetical protein n=1 Tax=Turicimonas muris TaxID=1796652 RepID=UPI00272C5538|nr:hypothetical protein [Turicimonas muris]
MAKFSNFKDSKTKQEEQQTPQYVTVHCCAPGCGFTETVNASDPRPFTCKYHQQADRRFWPYVTKNIKEFIGYYNMAIEYSINRKFQRFEWKEIELLNDWAVNVGHPELAPKTITKPNGQTDYESCYSFGTRILAFFEKQISTEFMRDEKKNSMEQAIEKEKKDKIDKTYGLIKSFDLAKKLQNQFSNANQYEYPF